MPNSLEKYEISDEPSRLDRNAVSRFLGSSYWAATRSLETIQRSIENSICYGAYLDGEQIAFARVVTDRAVMFWLCDVFVAEAHRGRGIGKAMVQRILEDERLAGLAGLLSTKDAHSLYERFGFQRDGERLMFRMPSPARVVDHAPAQDQSPIV